MAGKKTIWSQLKDHPLVVVSGFVVAAFAAGVYVVVFFDSRWRPIEAGPAPDPPPPAEAPAHVAPVAPAGKDMDVGRYYTASGYMGDIGDVSLEDGEEGAVRFTYAVQGRGPHEFEFKFRDDGSLDPRPAKFAGVLWLSPPNDFGTRPDCGYDLRKMRGRMSWDARSIGEPVVVEFLIGGVNWAWAQDERGRWIKKESPFGDTLRRYGLGVRALNSNWQHFDEDLHHLPEDAFRRVVGGFGWTATWSNNGLAPAPDGLRPEHPKTLVFEVRNVQYHAE